MNSAYMYHMQVQELGAEPIIFPGFTMAVFDLPNGRTSDEWNTEVMFFPVFYYYTVALESYFSDTYYYVDVCTYHCFIFFVP